jgi:hypothetical protein
VQHYLSIFGTLRFDFAVAILSYRQLVRSLPSPFGRGPFSRRLAEPSITLGAVRIRFSSIGDLGNLDWSCEMTWKGTPTEGRGEGMHGEWETLSKLFPSTLYYFPFRIF